MDKKNKPRVFLSHSAKDKNFIDKLSSDLRKCNIEPWLDSEEIRDGKSWQKVIFEDGIPTCDSVIVYFTINSLKSKMVSKEIDAALLSNLSDNGIAFLPYVESEELRDNLRLDIRSLHCREWNNSNYHEIFPSVVSEIWHSYLERIIETVTLKEKFERQQIEVKYKELRSNLNDKPFSKQTLNDFKYIFNELNKMAIIEIGMSYRSDNPFSREPRTIFEYSFKFLEALTYYLNKGYNTYNYSGFESVVGKFLEEDQKNDFPNDVVIYPMGITPNFSVDLRTFSLTRPSPHFEDQFTSKIYKFKYWLGYNKLVSPSINLKKIKSYKEKL